MKRFKFNNIKEVLFSIKNKNFDRNFASLIGLSYSIDEGEIGGYSFEFDEDKLNKYSFLFNFFDVDQIGLSDEEFKKIVETILLFTSEDIKPTEIKKILYEKQLKELECKFNKKIISKEVYNSQVNKYID
ncbi:hypothetical protein ACPDHL_09485 [Myroides sp. C15-4]|uniref:hypothetical protein n=1 Tax=unclassified Myroides TaxID=2642485 RepID=UPI0015F9FB42|nr:hypothetical protein [Myroides sp. WP-1]MBB1139565.1 hypothetical protein [Myroides sp. WP-1]